MVLRHTMLFIIRFSLLLILNPISIQQHFAGVFLSGFSRFLKETYILINTPSST